MKGLLWGVFVVLFIVFSIMPDAGSGGGSSDIDKIIAAKNIVRTTVANYPDTLDFYDYSYSPKVNGDTVTLKFGCKNAFGVQETHIMDIEVR